MAVSQSQPQTRLVKRVAAFTGDGTWTVPAGVTYAIAHMLGGGGGGAVGETGGDGGNSEVEFSSGTVVGPGGSKGRTTGGDEFDPAMDGLPNTGRGAKQATVRRTSSAHDGQWNVAGAPVTPAESINVIVGAGGTGTVVGGSGYVYIEYYEEVFV